jgi:hypothetical protein
MHGPNPFSVLLSILRARRLARPRPAGSDRFDHSPLNPVLAAVAKGGIDQLETHASALGGYLDSLATVDPDDLTRDEALAYWINLYNAAALDLARRARRDQHESVLAVVGGFDSPVVRIGSEGLTLNGIEHGKIRRFGDPRIHAALVCGSLSCPTLRFEAFVGDSLDQQLDEQMSHFLAAGGFIADRSSSEVEMSRVLLWYGSDFVRPHRMPTLLPARKRQVAAAVATWLTRDDADWLLKTRPKVGFQRYDWALGCDVRNRPESV